LTEDLAGDADRIANIGFRNLSPAGVAAFRRAMSRAGNP
jgi:hypothetical protein